VNRIVGRRAGGAVLSISLVWAATALAHDVGGAEARFRLDPLPRALAGIVVEVHTTLAPQLVVENKTDKTLEVLDENGVPFLRLRRGGVEGNFSVDELYRSDSPMSVARSATPAGAAPNWKPLSSNPSWGWFDERLRVAAAAAGARHHDHLRRWRVPLHIDGVAVAVTGTADTSPNPGSWDVRLTSPHEPVAGVHVILLPGRVPALFLETSTNESVIVLGSSGEPFLRFDSRGVDANVRSASWRENALARGEQVALPIDPKAPPDWKSVSSSSKYGWVEFRAWPGSDEPNTHAPAAFRWSVPLEVGSQKIAVEGKTVWKAGGTSYGHARDHR